ncbi:MAG: dTDP-4-dehydrorhamnose reductase [Bacteroidota bacterium]|nr:dTDP-4-dehydrorhamnose reductase [Bacteroidota bacterium]
MYYHQLVKKRIIIFGANGMLGQYLVNYFSRSRYYEVMASSVEETSVINYPQYIQCDITNRESVKDAIYNFYPDFIINAAAFTNVDKSETMREEAWKVNVKAVEYMAETARVQDIHLIHISSDYVFDGLAGPYKETDKPNPLGYYGRTKLASENALKISGSNFTIIRTNVLYGISQSRPDFVKWLVTELMNNKQVKIVTDQINNPTFIPDLCDAIVKIVETSKDGLFNVGGCEFISRYDFSVMIADFFTLDKSLILPIITEELKQPAKRPLKSGLVIEKARKELNYRPRTLLDTLKIIKNTSKL